MSLKRLLIATSVDRLILIVKKRKEISLSDAAKYLGVSEDQVEEWVRILEEHNYLKLKYPAIGKPKILLGEVPKEQLEIKEEELGKRTEVVEKKAEKFEKKISTTEGKVRKSEKELENLGKKLHKKMGGVKKVEVKLTRLRRKKEISTRKAKRMELLSKSKKIKAEQLKRVEYERRRVLGDVRKLEDIIDKTSKELEGVESFATSIERQINLDLKKLKDHQIDIGDLEKRREK